MKKLNKIFTIILCLALLFGVMPTGYAAEYSVIELYKVELSGDGACTIDGRVFGEPFSEVTLKANNQTSVTTAGTDGAFSFETSVGFSAYSFEISSQSGSVFSFDADFSGLSELFGMGEEYGYEINAVTFTHEGVAIGGTHSEAAGDNVTLTLTNPQNPTDFKAFVQTKADENGAFGLEFKVAEGEYTLNIKANGFDTASCKVKLPDMTDILSVGEDDTDLIELYKVKLSGDGACTIDGRVFGEPFSEVTLKANNQTSVTTAGTDGAFSFEVSVGFSAYSFEISSQSGSVFNFDADFSGLSEVFGMGEEYGYEINAVTFTHEGVAIGGTHTEAAGDNVTLTLTNPQNPMDFKAFVQTKADENGAFGLEFKVAEGEYTLNIKANGFASVSCAVELPDMTDILSVGEDDTDAFVKKLKTYAEEIRTLTEQCREKNIPTVYEEASLAVIEAFIDNIELEAEYEDYTRMGQYNYALTEIYRETVDSLEKYLKGDKAAFDVPRYVTGDIRKDGTSLVATVEDLNGQRVQPTFFTGLMSIDYACGDMIPQFAKMGLNATQIGVNPMNFFTDYDPHILNGWYHFEIGEVNSTAEITAEEYAEGGKSFKIVNPDSFNNDNYRRFTNYIDVKPNTTYRWGFKAKGSNINNTWFNPDNRIGKGYKYITASDDWKSYDYVYTTGEKQTVMELTFGCEDICDVVYIDDVYVKEDGADENLVTNGGFEDDTPREKSQLDIEMEEYGWYINQFGLKWLRKTLESAEEHNFMVDIMVPIDLIPGCVKDADPTMTECVSQFIPFALDNEVARDYVRFLALTMADVAQDYESVNSICLNNEPWLDTNSNSRFNSEDTGYYDEAWHNYLKEIYGSSIDKLNENYESDYTSFEQVDMPTKIDGAPVYTDYRGFNEKLLNEFFEWYEGAVRPYTGDLNLHIKIMDYFRYNWKDPYVEGGTNYDILHDKFDINGCDAHSYFGDSNTPMPLKMGWYDFMASVKDAPVYDTESHIVHDRKVVEYDELITDYYGADVWNGAIHGRAVDIIWNYDTEPVRNAVGGSGYANANMAHRPSELAEIAKTSLDLQRLSKEITAIQKEEPKVGLMYSWSNLTINDNHMTAVAAAYEDIIYSGQKVGMVTDSAYEDMGKYDLLVIPDVAYAPEKVLKCIKEFMENGGEVLILGDETFKYDRYGKAAESETADYILQNADRESNVSDKIAEMNLSEIVIVDAETGESVDDIEWSYAKYDDKYIVNILNYDKTKTQNIKLLLNGAEVTNVTELRSGEKSESGCLTAEAFRPMLAAFSQFTFDIVDESGNVVKENIDIPETGIIKCNVQTEGSVILALYKDNVLVDISIGDDTINVNLSDDGSYCLMATVWDMETMSPLSASRTLGE